MGVHRRTTNQGKARAGRRCGSCTLCCTALEIESRPGYSTRLDSGEDLAKPAGRPCPYLGLKGCTIYEARPVVCRQFACGWLMGAKEFEGQDHPQVTGVIGVRGFLVRLESLLIVGDQILKDIE